MQVLFLRIFKNSISCPKNGTVVEKDIRVRYQVVKDQPCVKPMLKHKKIHIPCLWKCVLVDKTHSKATEYLRIIDSDLLLSKSYQIRQLSLETPVFIAFAEPFTYSSSLLTSISCGRYVPKSTISCGVYLSIPPILWLFVSVC